MRRNARRTVYRWCFYVASWIPVILFSAPPTAEAGIADIYGSSAIMAVRGGGSADALPADAALLNPARLAAVQNIDLLAGITVAAPNLRIQNSDAGIGTYVGYTLGLAARLPLGSLDDRVFLGVHVHLPHAGLYDLQASLPDAPRPLFHDAHTRHFDFAFGGAIRIWRSLAVGAGFTLLPDVEGTVSIDFRNDSDAHSTDVRVNYNFAPTVGISGNPWQGLWLGFSWRGAHRTSLHIPVDVVVSDQIGAVYTSVSGVAFGEPDRFLFGVSYDFGHLCETPLTRFTARAEFGYEHYREDVASTSAVTLYDEKGNVLDVSQPRPLDFHDSWHIAASLDWQPLDELTVSAGYVWQTSPVPAQRSILNLLDASRHVISFGLTGWLPRQWLSSPREIGFSTAALVSVYQRREMEKYEMLNGHYGYPGISFDGSFWSWHFSLLLHF